LPVTTAAQHPVNDVAFGGDGALQSVIESGVTLPVTTAAQHPVNDVVIGGDGPLQSVIESDFVLPVTTSKRRSTEYGYLKTEINVDGYSGEILLLGHVGELHYISLDKVTVPVATTEKPAMSPEKCLPTISSKASVCGHCESQCCTKNEPNQPVREETLKKTRCCYVTKGKKKTRCVQAQWFEAFKWLTLCKSRQKLLPSLAKTSRNMSDWKICKCKLLKNSGKEYVSTCGELVPAKTFSGFTPYCCKQKCTEHVTN